MSTQFCANGRKERQSRFLYRSALATAYLQEWFQLVKPALADNVVAGGIRVVAIVGQGSGRGEDRRVAEIDDMHPILSRLGAQRIVVGDHLLAHTLPLCLGDARKGRFAGIGWIGDDGAL